MKETLTCLLALFVVLSLAGCGARGSTSQVGTEGSPTDDETYVIKFGQADTETCPLGVAMTTFEKTVEQKTNGKVDVQLLHNGVMGGEAEMVNAVQLGTLDIMTGSPSVLTSFSEKFGFMELPFLFRSADDLHAAWDNGLEALYNEWLSSQALECRGLVTLGARGLSNSKREVHIPADMSGLKIRVMESPVFINTFTAMGANPTPMNYNEVYTGLQQGTIDGQDNPAIFTVSAKFYEVQSYYTNLGHTFCLSATICRDGYLDQFPDDIAAIIAEALEAFEQEACELAVAEEETALKTMVDAGLTVTDLTEEEYNQFKSCTEDIVEEFRSVAGDEAFAIVEQYS